MKSVLVQAYGGVFPGSPPLDPNSYSKCYGMQLDGFVSVATTTNIQTSSTDNNTYQFANQFRCRHPEAAPAKHASSALMYLDSSYSTTSQPGKEHEHLYC